MLLYGLNPIKKSSAVAEMGDRLATIGTGLPLYQVAS